MASIVFIIEQFKSDPSRLLEHLPVRQVCEQLQLTWRERCLAPATTTALFIQQIIHGNSSCAKVRHLGDRRFSAQAYCKARRRLPSEVIRRLSRGLCDAARRQRQSEIGDVFLTHRVFVVDGSTFSMPDTPQLQAEFGQPGVQKSGCGFPMAHLLAMFDLNTGMLLDAIASPMRTHDLAKVAAMHPLLREGDLLMGDTAFGSYVHIAQLLQAKLHGLMPAHQARIMDFTPHRPHVRQQDVDDSTRHLPRSKWIRSLGTDDQIVEWFKPKSAPKYLDKAEYDALPDSIQVRELRRRVYHPGLECWTELTVVTTLLDPKLYPAGKLVELRLRRWQAEINLRHLKTTMGLDVLKCKTVEGVRKELAVFALVYNLVCLLMLEAASRQNTQPDRISFADVLGWLQTARPGGAMPRFITNPIRKTRIDPRAVKRRRNSYDLLNRPRPEMREALKKQAQAA
jgi:hypothetical protein